MRKIPLKNYIIYSVVIIVTILIAIYVTLLFKKSKEYYENNSVMKDILYEILPKDNLDINENLKNYLLENSDLVIYISSGKDKDIKDFENEFKDYIVDKKLQEDLIYIDYNNIKKTNFINELIDNYSNTENISNYSIISNSPILITFEEGHISSIYNKKNPSVYEINWFLIGNGVVEND